MAVCLPIGRGWRSRGSAEVAAAEQDVREISVRQQGVIQEDGQSDGQHAALPGH